MQKFSPCSKSTKVSSPQMASRICSRVTRDPAMIQQKRKHARRLLLNPGQRAVLAQLKRLLVELKFPKSNG